MTVDTVTCVVEYKNDIVVENNDFCDCALCEAECEEEAEEMKKNLEESLKDYAGNVWAQAGKGAYQPVAADNLKRLPAAMYRVDCGPSGFVVVEVPNPGDALFSWDGSPIEAVVRDIETFWSAEDKFRRLGVLWKRGILLHGPPGCGKTSILRLVSQEMIRRGGLVVMGGTNMCELAAGLAVIRRIEKERPIVVLLEDLDELQERNGGALLSMLDGELQVDNVVFLATTNYPDRLDPRLVNRPSRFDIVRAIGMPDATGRREFIQRRAGDFNLAADEIERWVSVTDGFSLAHVKEALLGVYIFDLTVEESCRRMKALLDGSAAWRQTGKGMNLGSYA